MTLTAPSGDIFEQNQKSAPFLRETRNRWPLVGSHRLQKRKCLTKTRKTICQRKQLLSPCDLIVSLKNNGAVIGACAFSFIRFRTKKKKWPRRQTCFKVKGAIFINWSFSISFIRLPKYRLIVFAINLKQTNNLFEKRNRSGRSGRRAVGHFSFIGNSERPAGAPRADPSAKIEVGLFGKAKITSRRGNLFFLLLVPSASPCAAIFFHKNWFATFSKSRPFATE